MEYVEDVLNLRNINSEFYYSGCFDVEHGILPSYYDSDKGNLLVFDTTDCDEITIESICNATVSKGAYEYLSSVLNTCKNTLIMWSQVEGTTSDYIIYHNVDTDSLIMDEITLDKVLSDIHSNVVKEDGCASYKFKEIKDNYMKRIKF